MNPRCNIYWFDSCIGPSLYDCSLSQSLSECPSSTQIQILKYSLDFTMTLPIGSYMTVQVLAQSEVKLLIYHKIIRAAVVVSFTRHRNNSVMT